MDGMAWKALLTEIGIPLLSMILLPLALMLVNRLIRVMENKWGVEIGEKKKKQIDELVEEAVDYAEEQSRKAVKGDADIDEIFKSEEKMNMALEYLRKRGEQLGVDEIAQESADNLAKLIESKLFKKRKEDEGDK